MPRTTESSTETLSPKNLRPQIDRLFTTDRPRFKRLWAYYRNAMRVCGNGDSNSARLYRQAQEWGLPPRITGTRSDPNSAESFSSEEFPRKEVVIENDIAWRIDTMVEVFPDCGNPTGYAARLRCCPAFAITPSRSIDSSNIRGMLGLRLNSLSPNSTQI